MTVAKTNAVLEAGKPEAIERQLASLRAITAEIDRMRLHVEAKTLAAKEEITEIQTWDDHLDTKFEEADNEVVKVRKWLYDRKKEAEVLAQEEKLQFEENFTKPSWNSKRSSRLRRLANTRFTPTRIRIQFPPPTPNLIKLWCISFPFSAFAHDGLKTGQMSTNLQTDFIRERYITILHYTRPSIKAKSSHSKTHCGKVSLPRV